MIDDSIIKEARQTIVDQNKDRGVELANQVIADGQDGMELLTQAFIPGISEVGDQFGRESRHPFYPLRPTWITAMPLVRRR